MKGIVLGISGGVDSSTVAALSCRALGAGKVLGLMLPERESNGKHDLDDAKSVAKQFNLKTRVIDITPSLETTYETIPDFNPSDKISKGNVKARMRMIYIYYEANRLKRLVCGSSDKSETMMGYFTKWGDVASDISPIMDLFKTQVRKLGRYLNVPERVVAKPSSPALWPGQLAEDELGIKYEQLDLVLYGLEHFMDLQKIAAQLDIKREVVESIRIRWLLMEHKRRVLLTPKLEYRTVAADFRLPRAA